MAILYLSRLADHTEKRKTQFLYFPQEKKIRFHYIFQIEQFFI